jgi:hypothetical protein
MTKHGSQFIKHMENFFGLLTTLIIIFQSVSPAFAIIPRGSYPLYLRPNYKDQVEYIINNSCEPIGFVPYDGIVYYSCSSGEKFWAEVLVPVDNSIFYFKNQNKKSDETTDNSL